jgi:hypothetical protein
VLAVRVILTGVGREAERARQEGERIQRFADEAERATRCQARQGVLSDKPSHGFTLAATHRFGAWIIRKGLQDKKLPSKRSGTRGTPARQNYTS